jgi:hypothetical protein
LLQIFKVHESTSIHKKHYSESSSLHTEATKQLCELISWASKERKKRWQLTGDGETSKEDGVLTGEKLLRGQQLRWSRLGWKASHSDKT